MGACGFTVSYGGCGLGAKCTAAVRLLLRGLREARGEAAGGGAVSRAASAREVQGGGFEARGDAGTSGALEPLDARVAR